MKTLIVEDDFTNQCYLQTILSPFGASHIAVNGHKAVEAFCQAAESMQPFDLICMDIMMPLKNGLDALKEIRGREAFWKAGFKATMTDSVKVIMITANAGRANMESAFDAKCDGFLAKPVDRVKLVDLIRAFGLIPLRIKNR